MYIVNKNVFAKSIVWANKNIYYDKPNDQIENKRSMFLITMVNEDYFFGCPLTVNDSNHNRTVLRKKHYPLKQDSKITECLYKLTYEDLISNKYFMITDGTFEHFTRSLYQRIIIDQMESPKEYNELFVNEYLKSHQPNINDVIVYPSNEKIFKYYYILDEDENNYQLLKLNKLGLWNYNIDNSDEYIIVKPKSERFYDYYSKYNIINTVAITEKKTSPILIKK